VVLSVGESGGRSEATRNFLMKRIGEVRGHLLHKCREVSLKGGFEQET